MRYFLINYWNVIPVSKSPTYLAGTFKENLRKITDYFGVDRDYFETGEKFGSVPTFSPDHIELISAYDKLSNADKLAIMQIIKSLSAK